MNYGRVTRMERGTNIRSTPDVSLCFEGLGERLEWEVVRELGSYHFPILIRTKEERREEEVEGRKEVVWDLKGGKWDMYQ